MSVPTIYVDMDGVIADFDTALQKLLGRSVGLGKMTSEEKWRIINEMPNFYRHLPVLAGAYDLWDFIIIKFSDTHNIEILTAIPKKVSMPSAEQDKRDWFAEHFTPAVPVKIGPFSHDKKNHCKSGDILIDDRIQNIKDWNEAGGIGILHVSNFETISILGNFFNNGCVQIDS